MHTSAGILFCQYRLVRPTCISATVYGRTFDIDMRIEYCPNRADE